MENENISQPISIPTQPETHNVPTNQPKPRNTKLIIIAFFIVLVLLVLGLAGAFALGKNSQTPTPTPTPEAVACTMEAKVCPDGVTSVGRSGPNCEFTACPTTTASDSADTSSWKTYTNTEYGISFKYPVEWKARLNNPSDIVGRDWTIGAYDPTPNAGGLTISGSSKSIDEAYKSEKANYSSGSSSIKSDVKVNLYGLEGRKITVENSAVPITYYVYYLDKNGQTITIEGASSSNELPYNTINEIFKTLSIK